MNNEPDVISKYRDERNKKLVENQPIGDMCEYCHQVGTRVKSRYTVGYDVCNKCGAPMKYILAICYGINVYSDDDYKKLVSYVYAHGRLVELNNA